MDMNFRGTIKWGYLLLAEFVNEDWPCPDRWMNT